MTKLRVEVRNKFTINNFHHSELVIPINLDTIDHGNNSKTMKR
jgi:hypothetical protein